MIFPCPALNGNGTFNDPSMDFSEIPMIHRWDSMGLQPGQLLKQDVSIGISMFIDSKGKV